MVINVLGLGNIIFGDEGFGVEMVRQLPEYNSYPDYVNFIDGGTQGIYLLDYFESPECLLILDAIIPVEYDAEVYSYQGSDLPSFIHRKLSSHQIGLSELLSLAKLHEKMPRKIALIGIPPDNLDMGMGLSPKVRALIPKALAETDQILQSWISTGINQQH
ncbi:MAG: HyaD/HybD family hydrogenase maturation endopeptidase [Candidatus Marinimicrobia bacterium]|nr:HyaD/HybD family hydrogenase maturation endopeptidase [Candidatus Neomarinimicrobiota bacterium]